MPPHLRKGDPVDQRFPALPTIQVLCTCRTCVLLTNIEYGTNRPIQGAYISKVQAAEHRRLDADLSVPRAILNPLQQPTLSFPFSSQTFGQNLGPLYYSENLPPSTLTPAPSPAEARHNHQSSNNYHATEHLETLLDQAREYRKKLSSQSLSTVLPKPCVLEFSQPPSRHSHPLSASANAPDLLPTSNQNATLADWKALLSEVKRFCAAFHVDPNDHRTPADQLRRNREALTQRVLQEESRITNLVKEEWERRRNVLLEHSEHVIDTGMFPSKLLPQSISSHWF